MAREWKRVCRCGVQQAEGDCTGQGGCGAAEATELETADWGCGGGGLSEENTCGRSEKAEAAGILQGEERVGARGYGVAARADPVGMADAEPYSGEEGVDDEICACTVGDG